MNNTIPNPFDIIVRKLESMQDEIRSLRAVIEDNRPDTIDRAEAAKILGISAHTIGKWTRERRIPFIQDIPGGKVVFSRKALEAWKEGNRQRTAGEIGGGV